MDEQIKNHFEMKLLWENKRIMDEKGNIKDIYLQPERSKREDSNLVYALFEISQIHPRADRIGEVLTRQEAEKWVGNNSLRCWHEHIRDAVL